MAENKTDILGTAGAIMGGIGTIGGWLGIGEGRQDKRQIKQQTKLNEVNAKTAKEMADYEQALKLKMWKDTNYGGNLEQAALAGVSKAAAIGGGIGGSQAATVGNAGGGSAADAASTTNARTAMMQQGMQLQSQLALQKAQKENIEADTVNKQAVATKTSGVDTESAKADVTNKGTQNDLMKIEKGLREIGLRVAGETENDAVIAIQSEATRMLNEANISKDNQYISGGTREDKINKIKAEAIGAMLHNNATRAGIKLTEEQAAKIGVELEQKWRDLSLTGRGQDMTQENVEKQVNGLLMAAGINAIGNLTGTTVRGITDMLKSKRGSTTETTTIGDKNFKQTKTTTRGN